MPRKSDVGVKRKLYVKFAGENADYERDVRRDSKKFFRDVERLCKIAGSFLVIILNVKYWLKTFFYIDIAYRCFYLENEFYETMLLRMRV